MEKNATMNMRTVNAASSGQPGKITSEKLTNMDIITLNGEMTQEKYAN